jgi:hypothetical protein
MIADAFELEGVVVTALGIKKKALGYATQQVSGEESDVKALTNSLSGKVAGLDIKSSEISVGLQVVIRGNSSIQGNNQALCC